MEIGCGAIHQMSTSFIDSDGLVIDTGSNFNQRIRTLLDQTNCRAYQQFSTMKRLQPWSSQAAGNCLAIMTFFLVDGRLLWVSVIMDRSDLWPTTYMMQRVSTWASESAATEIIQQLVRGGWNFSCSWSHLAKYVRQGWFTDRQIVVPITFVSV